MGLAFAFGAVTPSTAQLVIDRSAPTPYPMPPKVEPEKAEEKAKEPLRYSGERIEITSDCEEMRLSAAGMICAEASPCEMRLELTAGVNAGDAVVAIGDLYSVSATLESIVLRSEDGGATWVEAADRIAGVSLDEIQFSGDEHGWIVAREHIGGGHRPFLLATDDGGRTWSARSIDDDEDFRGAVLQLRFDSPEHGYLVVEQAAGAGDPYEMRETHNGGRSWSLRQVTADRPALPGSRRRIPDPVVQVREDSADDHYVVERRANGDWAAIGRFLGSAGTCPIQ
jgi:hypothetical protein